MKNSDLKARLARYRQIKLSVIGRRSGRTISLPVWFVLDDEKLYLLPVQGSDTQWYKNVLKNPSIGIDARGVEAEFRALDVLSQMRKLFSGSPSSLVGHRIGYSHKGSSCKGGTSPAGQGRNR